MSRIGWFGLRTRGQSGMTLVELLTAVAIISSLMVISTFAIRSYSHHQQIQGAEDAMVSQLRQLQERAITISNPSVFGAWFRTGGSSDWGPVEYVPNDPDTSANEQACLLRGERGFDTGPFDIGNVEIEAVDFADGPEVAATVSLAAFCLGELSIDPMGGVVDLAFFFPKGDATKGCFRINHVRIDDPRTVQVLGITGRVQLVDEPCPPPPP